MYKPNTTQNNRQSEDLNRDRQDPGTSSSDPNGKRRVGHAKFSGNANKKNINSRDDDSISLFAPSGVEDESQRRGRSFK